jgi:hypothetical protein
MNNCMARRGFLSLSNCDAPASRPCSACGRMMCPDHLSPASGFAQCLECANGRETGPLDESAKINDSDSAYRYRESYYADRGYSPVPVAFSRHDSRSFDRTTPDSISDDDAGHSGFGDS